MIVWFVCLLGVIRRLTSSLQRRVPTKTSSLMTITEVLTTTGTKTKTLRQIHRDDSSLNYWYLNTTSDYERCWEIVFDPSVESLQLCTVRFDTESSYDGVLIADGEWSTDSTGNVHLCHKINNSLLLLCGSCEFIRLLGHHWSGIGAFRRFG